MCHGVFGDTSCALSEVTTSVVRVVPWIVLQPIELHSRLGLDKLKMTTTLIWNYEDVNE